ncbi:MAG: NAD(P)/FAD-dependent oxidoreductase, partial [Pseudomonadota bacterium]
LQSQKRSAPKTRLKSLLGEALPARLASALSERFDEPGDLATIADKRLSEIEHALFNWSFNPNGTEGFAKAEVTAGGVDTADLSSRTMEAKDVPGLYVIGEAVDVTGWLGGYNFQWAWSSGVAAGSAI